MTLRARRAAVVSDVHGNPWALRAILEEVRQADVDLVVNCGDLLAGPWPTQVLDDLLDCGAPVLSVRGNGDRGVCEGYDGRWEEVPAQALPTFRRAARQLRPEDRRWAGSLPLVAEAVVEDLGRVTFCHATPRSDEEILLPTSSEERVGELLSSATGDVFVHGHSHLQDDRRVAGRRVVNAGSAGKPFDQPGAAWLLLGPEIELRRTWYDTTSAAREAQELLRDDPDGLQLAEDFASSILTVPGRADMLDLMGGWERAQVGKLTPRSLLQRLDPE